MNPARSLTHALLLATLFASFARAADPAPAAGKLDPKQIEVTLTPDKTSILPGEPVFFTVTVKVKSAPNFLMVFPVRQWPHIYMSVTDQDGRKAPPPGKWLGYACYFGGGPDVPGSGKPPYQSEYTFRFFLPFSASLQKPGVYTVAASGALGFDKYGDQSVSFSPHIGIPMEATTKLEVTQPDEKKLGEIINNLVKRAGANRDTPDAQNAALELASIPDERVIPYFRGELEQIMKNGWYAEADTRVLEQFNSDAALDALKECMETPASGKTGRQSRSLADAIHTNHLLAAEALAESPHPGAIPYLLTRRNDPYSMVRSEIVRVLGTKVPPAQAIPILKEMAADKNAGVRKEAKDCLDKLTAKNKTQSRPQSL